MEPFLCCFLFNLFATLCDLVSIRGMDNKHQQSWPSLNLLTDPVGVGGSDAGWPRWQPSMKESGSGSGGLWQIREMIPAYYNVSANYTGWLYTSDPPMCCVDPAALLDSRPPPPAFPPPPG